MNVSISQSKISGTVTAPPSKSATHRAIIIASLSPGMSKLKNVLLSDDTKATIYALKQLGVKIQEQGNTVIIQGSGGNLIASSTPIFLNNSGTSLRLLAGIAALAKGKTTLTGEKRLTERPMEDLLAALNKAGIYAQSLKNNNCAPIEITGGKIIGGTLHIKGNVSSQYISSLLLIAPFATDTLTIIIEGELKSKPYVALTIDVMNAFGVNVINEEYKKFIVEKGQAYHSKEYTIEGDYSSASYFFAAAAIGGKITVFGLSHQSLQGDKHFLNILERMGCKILMEKNGITVIRPDKLKAIEVDMGNYPDIVQTLAIVASFAKGKTHITNIRHVKDKETNRIEATAKELRKMGIEAKTTSDSLTIIGGEPQSATIKTHNDHRMAMSFAVAGLAANGETIIQNAEVISKSYPHFFEDMEKIGGKISR